MDTQLYKNKNINSDHVSIIGTFYIPGEEKPINILFQNILNQIRPYNPVIKHGNSPWGDVKESDEEYSNRLNTLKNLYRSKKTDLLLLQEAFDMREIEEYKKIYNTDPHNHQVTSTAIFVRKDSNIKVEPADDIWKAIYNEIDNEIHTKKLLLREEKNITEQHN